VSYIERRGTRIDMELTNKQRAFVIEYVIDFNAKQASIRAGYAVASAHVSGHSNINNPKIMQAIEDYFSVLSMSSNETLARITKIARGQHTDSDINSELRALDLMAKHHNLTNTTIARTWRDDAIDKIKDGTIDYDILKSLVLEMNEPESLADNLFKQANVPITNKIS